MIIFAIIVLRMIFVGWCELLEGHYGWFLLNFACAFAVVLPAYLQVVALE